MKTTRRYCIKSGLAGAGLLAGSGAARGFAFTLSGAGVGLNYDPKLSFPLKPDFEVPPDEVRMLGGYIHSYTPPEGSMDIEGGWTAVFDMLSFSSIPGHPSAPSDPPMTNSMIGQVALSRRRGSTDYRVQMDFRPTGATEEITALIRCGSDPLRSLRDYELTWNCKTANSAIAYTRNEAGSVQSGALQTVSGAITESFSVNRPLTSLWTLFDAVRLMPAQAGWMQEFDLWMDLSSLRRNQRLCYCGSGTVQTASGVLPLRFYEQTGTGTTPVHYAVDEQQRALFITQGQLGWGLNRIERF
jgi:hypothetical protein